MGKKLLKLKIRLFIFTLLLLAGFTVYANLIPAINASFSILNTKAIVNNVNNTPNTYEENLSLSDNLFFVNFLGADTLTPLADFKKVFEKLEAVILKENLVKDENEEGLKASFIAGANCKDITVQLDATGNVTIVADDINNGSTGSSGFTISADPLNFNCGNIGENTVTLTVTDPDSSTNSCTATVTVQPFVTNATVNYSISPNKTTICDFEELTFTATSNNMPSPLYQWFINGTSQGAPSSSSTFTKTGVWDNGTNNVEVVATSASSSCTPPVSEVKPISVNVAKPISFNITGPSTICAGEIANFTVTNKLNVGSTSTYEWFRGDGTVPTGETSQSYSPSNLTNGEVILLKIVSSTPCATPIPPLAKESTNTITMTVNPLATLTVISGSVCANGQSSIDLNSLVTTNGTTVTYHNNLTQAQNGTNAINSTVSPTTARSYFVRSRLNTGCFTTAEIPITIDPLPDVDAGFNEAICTGFDFDLSEFSNGANRTYYNSQTNANNETNAISSIVSPTSNTTYYVRAEDPTTGCYNTDSVIITVNPLPTLNITSGSVCDEGQTSIDLNTLVTSNGTKTFYGTSTNAESGTNPITATVSPTIATDYYVRTQLGTGCYKTGTVSVTIDALPTLSTTDSSVCASGQTSIDLNSKVTTNGNNVTFYSSLANAQNGTSAINATVSPTTETTYHVRSQFTNGCYRTDQIVISIDALPTFDVTPAEICNGAFIDLNSTVSNKSNGSDTITFYNSQTNANNGTSSINVNVSPTSTTTYYIRSVNSAGCFTTNSVLITVAANASISLNSAEENIQSICTFNNISPIDYTISGGGSGAGATLSVTPTTDHNFTGNYSNGVFTISGTATTAGTYNYIINTTGCGADSATGTITVYSGVPATPTGLATLSTSFIICPTSTETYEVNEDLNAVSYSWTFPPGFTVTSGANTRKVTVNVATNATSGNLTVRATNPCGNSSTVSSPVNIGTVTADAGPDQYICFGSTTIATPIRLAGNVSGVNANKYGSTGNGEWWWSDNGAGGTFRKSGGNDASYQNGWYDLPPSATADQTIKLTIQTKKPTGSNNCGQGAKDDMFIYLRPVPTASVLSNGDICAGSNGVATFSGTPNTTITYKIGASGANQTVLLNAGGITSPATVDIGALTATTDIIIQSVAYTNNTACTNTYSSSNKPTATIVVKNTPVSNAGNDISICADQTAQLAGVITGDITTGVWTGGTGTFTPNRNTLNAVYTPSSSEITTGSVTLGLTSNNPTGPCGVSPTDEVIIAINEIPTVDAGILNDICQSSSPSDITLSSATIGGGNGNTTAAWSITEGGGQLSSTAQTANPASVTYTPAANYFGQVTLTLTTNAPGVCLSVSDTVSFTLDEAPTVATGNYSDICQSDSPAAITLSGATIGGGNGNTTAQWSIVSGGGTLAPASGFSATPQTVTYTPAVNYSGDIVLKLTSNANGTCSAVEETTTISVNEAAVVDAGSAVTICEGETVTLAGSISGSATSATWTAPSGSFSSSMDLNAVYTPSITKGTVTLTLTTDNPTGQCEIETSTVDITVNEAANVSVSGDALICSDSAANIVADLSGGSATSGTWSSSSNNSAGFGSTTANTTTYTPNATDIANETVTLTFTTEDVDGSGPCAIANDDFVITVGNDIYINEQPSNIGVCVSDAASFTVLVEGANDLNDISYQWYKVNSPDDTIVTGATSETLSFSQTTLADNGEYYVIVQGAAPCAEIISDQAVLNVNKDIVITTQPTAVTECIDGTANFTVTAAGNIDQYTWFRTDNKAVSGTSNLSEANGVSTITLDFTNLETTEDGEYYLLIEGFDGTCPDVESARVQLTVNSLPTIDAGENQTICSDGFATLSGSITEGATTGIWSGGSGTFSPNNTDLNATYTPSPSEIANGSVVLTLTSTNANAPCPENNDTLEITINPVPTITIEDDKAICSSTTSVPLTASYGGGATQGTWSVVTSAAGTITNNDTYIPSASILSSGGNVQLEYTTEDPDGPCVAAKKTLTITINPVPVVTAGPNQTVCSNIMDVQLAGSVTGGSTTGQWTTSGDGIFSTNNTDLNATYTPSESDITKGTVTLTLASTNAVSPCSNPTSSLTLTIEKLPVINTLGYSSTAYCETDTVSYSPNLIITNGIGGTYSINPAVEDDNFNTETGVLIPNGLAVGNYDITYTANKPSSCSTTDINKTITVAISPKPDATFSYAKSTFCSNEENPSPTFTNTTAYSGASFSSTPAGVQFVSGSLGQINLTTSTPGTYSIKYTIPASDGCALVEYTVNNIVISPYVNPGAIKGVAYYSGNTTPNTRTATIIACHDGNGKIDFDTPGAPATKYIKEWQKRSSITAPWTPISNTANKLFYDFKGTVGVTSYRAVISSGSGCADAYTNIVNVSVIPANLKPNPVSVSNQVFCLGDYSDFSSTVDIGGDQLNEKGDFQTGQLNPNDPNSWLIDGRVKGWTASGDNTKPNQWSGTNPHSFNGTTYNSGDPKFGISYGNQINNQQNDPTYYWDNPYDNSAATVIATSIETPKFSLLYFQNPTFEFDEAYQLINGGWAIIEISLNGGSTYQQIPDYLIDGDDRTSSILQSGTTNQLSGNYGNFGNGTNHTVIDLSPYFGNPSVRIRLTMVRNATSVWAVDNFALPNNTGNAEVQWTDQFNNVLQPISGTDNVRVTPVTPGNQTFTVTSYVNGCRSLAPDGSENVQLKVHYANAGYDVIDDPTKCGSPAKLLAYDNTKTPLQNYLNFKNAGLWSDSDPIFQKIDNDNNNIWDLADAADIAKHNPGVGIYTYTDHPGGPTLPAGRYRDYGPTTATQAWSIVSGPTDLGINWTTENAANYFTNINDAKAEFKGPGGQYTLRWTITDGSISCYDDVVLNLTTCTKLDWDGVDDHVVFGNVHNLTNPFSLEVWVRAGSQNQNKVLISKRTTGDGYSLEFLGNTPQFKMYNGATTTTVSAPGYVVGAVKNRWHHIAVTYNGSNLIMYVDGLLAQSVSSTAGIGTNTAEFMLGAMSDGTGYAKNFYHGWMDEVRIWNKALTQMQIQEMMNQEITDNGGVRGAITNQLINGLSWADLSSYYQMNVISRDHTPLDCTDAPTAGNDIINGFLQDNAGVDNGTGKNGRLRLITTQQDETAPLPYTTKQPGDWNDVNTWTHGSTVWDVPNSKGFQNMDIDWNIVVLCHDVEANGKVRSNPEETDIDYVVSGLVSLNGKLTVIGTGALDETNNGSGLWVTHYLKLDGVIDLVGESQLVQKRYNANQFIESELDVNSSGYLERDQQGQANSFIYNYWSSPVSKTGDQTNNAPYSILDVMKYGTDSNSPTNFNLVNGPYSADDAALNTSTYWFWRFHGLADNYDSWIYIGDDLGGKKLNTGEAHTMKGVNGGMSKDATQNYVYKGKPHNGDITLTINPNENYLIGNPYPSALNGREFILDNISASGGRNGRNNFNGTIYFWDHFETTNHNLREYIGGYAVLNLLLGIPAASIDERIDNSVPKTGGKTPNHYIPVGQGFFISTVHDAVSDTLIEVVGGDFIFKNSQRIYKREMAPDNSIFLKPEITVKPSKEVTTNKEEDKIGIIRLGFLSPKGYIRQIAVGAHPATTNGFDIGYDAPMIDYNVEDMYWLQGGNFLVIQGVPDFGKDQVLPIGIRIDQAGEFKIKIDKLENMSDDQTIYLKDIVLDSIHDIRSGPYVSTSEAGEITERFQLIFHKESQQDPVIDEPIIDEPIIDDLTDISLLHSYTENEMMVLNPQELLISAIYLFDMNGKLLSVFEDVPSEKEIRLKVANFSEGVYVLKMHTDNEIITRKIIIKN